MPPSLGALGISSQKKTDSTGLRGVFRKGTLLSHLDPTQARDSGLLRSRDGIRAHVLEVTGNKAGIPFLSFSLVLF